MDTQRSLSIGKYDSPSANRILTLVFKTDLPVKLHNCIIFPAVMMECYKLNSYPYFRKNLEQQETNFKNCSTFLLRTSEPLVFSLIQSYVFSTSAEQVYVLNLESRRSDTLPILALLLISFLLLANQLYTLREVTRSKSDNFFPMKVTGRKKYSIVTRWVPEVGRRPLHM